MYTRQVSKKTKPESKENDQHVFFTSLLSIRLIDNFYNKLYAAHVHISYR